MLAALPPSNDNEVDAIKITAPPPPLATDDDNDGMLAPKNTIEHTRMAIIKKNQQQLNRWNIQSAHNQRKSQEYINKVEN